MSRTTYIDDLLYSLDFLEPSKENTSFKNPPDPKEFLEELFGFKLKDLKFDQEKVSRIEANYEEYRKEINRVQGIRGVIRFLSAMHPKARAREFLNELKNEIDKSLYTGKAMTNSIQAISEYIKCIEPENTEHSEKVLKKIKIFLKIFDVYNIKLDRNTNIEGYYVFSKLIDDELADISDTPITEMERCKHQKHFLDENELIRKKAWKDIQKLIKYDEYILIVRHLNHRAISSLNYLDHFDYLLAKNLFQDRVTFMDEVDRMIKAVRPQYNSLIGKMYRIGAKNTQNMASLTGSTDPKIKAWDQHFLYNKLENSDYFAPGKVVRNGVYEKSKVHKTIFRVFKLSTGYDVHTDDTKMYSTWDESVDKYIITHKELNGPQMLLYIFSSERGEPDKPSMMYIHNDTENLGIPCIVMHLPFADFTSSAKKFNVIGYSDVEALFQMFGKVAYYTVHQPTFLPSHDPPDTRTTMENPDFKLKLFEYLFANILREASILQNIVTPLFMRELFEDYFWGEKDVTPSYVSDLSDDDFSDRMYVFEYVSKELKLFQRNYDIIEGMNCMARLKFMEYMYSTANPKKFLKTLLCKKYHSICKEYILLDYDVTEDVTPFTECTRFLSGSSFLDKYLEYYAALVGSNICYNLSQANASSTNDISDKLMAFTANLCHSIRSSRDTQCTTSFKCQIVKLLRSNIDEKIFRKYEI
ncbi:hypothetical protein H4219_003440 [Mycoemilia scoparia]|uniref:Uncharacterized protein n=1 Tax=Mycoemilia scoparia TaxID=417184 RepID=A0A9W8A045_9FUNG|nr:hypothetical protein H4219_003440 [Mycoemilia scoparia]